MSRDASWTIKRSVADIKNQYTVSYTLTLTVTGTKMIGSDWYWVVVNDSDESKSYIRIMNDTVYTFADFATITSSSKPSSGFDTGFPAAVTQPGRTKNAGALVDPSPYTDPLPYIRLDAKPATTYDIMRYSEWIYSVGSFFKTWIGTYHGTETVTVTAGTFANCRKYEILYDSALVGGGSTQRRIITTMLWLAPNVGIVKLNETKTDGYTTMYTREEDLIGYSVP